MATAQFRNLVEQWIITDPRHVGPADVYIQGYGVPVWAIIAYMSAIRYNFSQAAEDFGVPGEAVIAAFAYYQANTEVIDGRIAANESHAA